MPLPKAASITARSMKTARVFIGCFYPMLCIGEKSVTKFRGYGTEFSSGVLEYGCGVANRVIDKTHTTVLAKVIYRVVDY